MKLFTALLFCLISGEAFGQAAVQQYGTIIPYDIPRWSRDHLIEDAGSITGKNGRGVNPFSILDNNGLGLCSYTDLTTKPYNAVCLGHDSNGDGILSIDSVGGLADKNFYILKDGIKYRFPIVFQAGKGINITSTPDLTTITNTGVTSITAGTGITLSGNTGDVTIFSTGGGGGGGGILGPGTSGLGNAVTWGNTTGDLLADTGAPPVIKVPTHTALVALTYAKTSNASIRRLGYLTEGDGPPLDFKWYTGTCTSRGLADDIAGCVDVPDGIHSLSGIFPGYVDVHWFGALDNAVPGGVGSACTGITGQDNAAAFNNAYSYAKTKRISLFAGGSGIFRLNSKWVLSGTAGAQPWNSNTLNPILVNVTVPIVTCGNDAGVVVQTNQAHGLKVYLHRLIGPGAGGSNPPAFSGAENIGVQISGTSQEDVEVGMISDYTYGMIVENSFSNRITLGLIEASYVGLYLRNGSCGVTCSTQNNIINFKKIGGVYTYNGDPSFALRQSRSNYIGVYLADISEGNVITGGTIEYNLKPSGGTDPSVNLLVQSNYNYITAWVEGNYPVTGQNLSVSGNHNFFWLSGMKSPSNGLTNNVVVSGTGNNLYGPVISDPVDISYGNIDIGGQNYVNNNPVTVNGGGLTFVCDVGTPTNITGTYRYKRSGSLVYIEAKINITTKGAGCLGGLNVTNLPAPTSTTRRDVAAGWNNAGIGLSCIFMEGTTTMAVAKSSDATFPGPDGTVAQCSGVYNAE